MPLIAPLLAVAIVVSGCSDDTTSIPVGPNEGEGEADGGGDGGAGDGGGGAKPSEGEGEAGDDGGDPGGEGGEGEGEQGGDGDGDAGEGEGEDEGDGGDDGGAVEGEGEGEVVVPGPECVDDDDCEAGWCRPNDPGGPDGDAKSCVPFLADGERCGGFVPEWASNRCADGLVCADSPPSLPDAPGWCRHRCEDDNECDDDQYCGVSGNCRPHGDCIEQADCQDDANEWDRILCDGVAFCGKDGCTVSCDQDATCFDFAEERVWFGACRQTLGWGVFDQECHQISGCDAGTFRLSDSEEACERACLGEAPDGQCRDDADCAPAGFCRPLEGDDDGRDAGSVCHPYEEEGQQCGGFVAPWHQRRCEPRMACTDIPEGLADAPGVCRDRCEHNNPDPVDECGARRYCSRNDACRPIGECFDHLDCELRINSWPHIECVGYGVCGDEGECGWRCGDARCRDLSDVWFGPCERLLGFGIRDGVCEAISGCDDPEYPMFETRRECQDLCERREVDPR